MDNPLIIGSIWMAGKARWTKNLPIWLFFQRSKQKGKQSMRGFPSLEFQVRGCSLYENNFEKDSMILQTRSLL